MKRLLSCILPLVFLILSCKKGHETDCFKGTGENITTTYPVEFFNKVEARGRISVHFIQDGKNEVEIMCGENILDGITFSVNNSTLLLNNEIKCNWVRRFDEIPVITVHYSELKYILADNYFDNRFLSCHTGDSITIEYWEGNGCTYFYGDVDYAGFFVHAGPGRFEAAGHSKYTMLYHSGSSPDNLTSLSSKTVHVNTKSNNDIKVSCDSLLLAEIYWTGNVFYSGNPQIIKRFGNGSGQLIEE